jgi:hypothetical protein
MKSIFPVVRRMSFAVLFAGILGVTAWAHPGHDKAITREQAMQRANAEIGRLAESGKLDKSWTVNARLQSAELRTAGTGKEWALIFSNEKAGEADKKTLYVFLSDTGEYLAANFTGR